MKTQMGHYDIVAELGRGGMGVVYKGFESSLNRYVAIKVLADSLAHDESVKERFLREARSMAALNDSHIIQIYFIGDDAGQAYFVMEFVEGEALSNVLKREGKLNIEQAAKIIHQTAQGLASAHDKGVIHRDIKPGNLMITSKGAVKIADFGIALVTHDFSKKLTSTGEFVGTPGYLSPEVCLGKPVDQRSDIFSLGIVLFEMLTGSMPFKDESPLGLMLEVVRADIPDVRQLNDKVDPDIARILVKMIAKEPTDRYQSCQELIADLGQHPLVAKGGPILLQTALSPAAATVIGAKTPVSGVKSLPPSSPQPLSSAPTHITPPMAQAAVHQPVLGRPQPARKSNALPFAIAAALLLGIGGSVYAFRDRIPYLNTLVPNNTAEVSVPTNTPTTATTPAAPPVVTPETNANSNPTATDTTTVASNIDTSAPNANNAANAATVNNTNQVALAPEPAPASQSNEPAAQSEDGPAARASRVGPLRELAAARAAESEPQQLARNTEPRQISEPAAPHIPTIAVIAAGDSVVSEPAEQLIEETLGRNGFNLVDQSVMPRVRHLLHGEHPDFGSVMQALNRTGKIDVVVFVQARPVGTQELTYYGQNSTLYTVQLSLKAYHLPGREMLGSGWNEQISFTSLNANEKVHEAIEPLMGEVADKLAEYRARRGKRG